jgi:L-ascorbate metabolism protein UlaG (beta-lactamase superfamily)
MVIRTRRHSALGRFVVPLLALSLLAGCAGVGEPKPGAPPHHRASGFANPNPAFSRPGAWTRARFFLSRFWTLAVQPPAADLPRPATDGRALAGHQGDPTITWVGHATFLIQLDGVNVLTDPQWSERASPLSFFGPRRLSPPGLAFEALPPIHAVVISHDHFDSLDLPTVQRLAGAHRPRFLVPLGLKAWFEANGIDAVEELDWWQSRTVGGLTLTCLPAQHWSARTPWDTNRRLWSGWAVAGRARRLFFGGDSGYTDDFKEIGGRLGPFDLAVVGIGAYDPPEMMKMTHTTPEEALRVFFDVRARRVVAMHWGTFALGAEPIDEPPRRLQREAVRLGLDADRVWVMKHGETRRW